MATTEPLLSPNPLWDASLQLILDQTGVIVAASAPADVLLVESGSAVGRALGDLVEGGHAGLGSAGGALTGVSRGSSRGVALRRSDRSVYMDIDAQRLDAPGAQRVGALLGLEPGRCVVHVALSDSTLRTAAEGELARLRARLSESERARAKLQELGAELSTEPGAEMVGSSRSLALVREQVLRVAPTNTTALIHGETGSGKELVARSIHAGSPRRASAFVPVNCAALPETLIESELFGHEKGAFTGADKRRLGKFELADGGTLFLDEIAELPPSAQGKLLRVLQDGTFGRVGGTETVTVDVRLIAASHRDLARQVERGRFREDLFYRLNVFKIQVPPLRDRREDLRELIEHLHARVARRMGKPTVPVSDRSMRRVLAYPWPGNVRELANAVERATLLCDGAELEIELPQSPLSGPAGEGGSSPNTPARDILLDLTLEQLQRLQITHALETTGYRVFGASGAAKKLDIQPGTLLARMDKFGIPRPRAVKRARGGGAGGAG